MSKNLEQFLQGLAAPAQTKTASAADFESMSLDELTAYCGLADDVAKIAEGAHCLPTDPPTKTEDGNKAKIPGGNPGATEKKASAASLGERFNENPELMAALPFIGPGFGGAIAGYQRGNPHGEGGMGALRGGLGSAGGSLAGALVGTQLGHVHPYLGIAGNLAGSYSGSYLGARAALKKYRDASAAEPAVVEEPPVAKEAGLATSLGEKAMNAFTSRGGEGSRRVLNAAQHVGSRLGAKSTESAVGRGLIAGGAGLSGAAAAATGATATHKKEKKAAPEHLGMLGWPGGAVAGYRRGAPVGDGAMGAVDGAVGSTLGGAAGGVAGLAGGGGLGALIGAGLAAATKHDPHQGAMLGGMAGGGLGMAAGGMYGSYKGTDLALAKYREAAANAQKVAAVTPAVGTGEEGYPLLPEYAALPRHQKMRPDVGAALGGIAGGALGVGGGVALHRAADAATRGAGPMVKVPLHVITGLLAAGGGLAGAAGGSILGYMGGRALLPPHAQDALDRQGEAEFNHEQELDRRGKL